MLLTDETATSFYHTFFPTYHTPPNSQPNPDQQKQNFFLKAGLDFKSYKTPTINYPKSIKQFAFVKKYDRICQIILHVSACRPQQLQSNQILYIIESIYACFLNFIHRGLWKSQPRQTYLQQLTLLYLHEFYTKAQPKTKRKYGTFDRFLLNVFYTLNILKTCNKFAKNFANFLHSTYSFCQLFLYICLKNMSIIEGNQQKVNSPIIKKIIKILQTDELSHSSQLSFSKDSLDLQSGKLVSINSIFVDPLGGSLLIPTVKMYRIMKICKILQQDQIKEEQTIEWGEFLKKYFQIVEQQSQICFEHLICATISKNTYELSRKLLTGRNTQIQQQFLEEAFSYIFQVLQIVFAETQPNIDDEKTLKNMQTLRKHYHLMKILNEHDVSFMNKFSKKLLKNNYILELYKKYS